MILPLNESYHICMEFTFEITPGHQDLAGQTRYVIGGYYTCKYYNILHTIMQVN